MTITGPEGVFETTLTPEQLVGYTAESDTPRGREGVVDRNKWFTDIAAGVSGGRTELVVTNETTGFSDSSTMMFTQRYYPGGEFDQWYGATHGHADGNGGGDGSWPPAEPPVESPPVPLRYTVRAMPGSDELIDELLGLAETSVGFGLTGIATGEVGPAVYRLGPDNNPTAVLGIGYTLTSAIVEALEELRRANQPD